MLEKYGNRIAATRGDSIYLQVAILNEQDQNPLTAPVEYELQDGDQLLFYLREKGGGETPVFSKTFSDTLIQLSATETALLKSGVYLYYVRILFSNGDVNTIIDGDTFELSENMSASAKYVPEMYLKTESYKRDNRFIGRIKEFSFSGTQKNSVEVDSYDKLPRPGSSGTVYLVRDDGTGSSSIYAWNNEIEDYVCYGTDGTKLNKHVTDFNNPHKVDLIQTGQPITNSDIEKIMNS